MEKPLFENRKLLGDFKKQHLKEERKYLNPQPGKNDRVD